RWILRPGWIVTPVSHWVQPSGPCTLPRSSPSNKDSAIRWPRSGSERGTSSTLACHEYSSSRADDPRPAFHVHPPPPLKTAEANSIGFAKAPSHSSLLIESISSRNQVTVVEKTTDAERPQTGARFNHCSRDSHGYYPHCGTQGR